MNMVIIGTPYDLVFIDLSQQAGFTFFISMLLPSGDAGISYGEIIDLAYRRTG
jgi:hypothetical protein